MFANSRTPGPAVATLALTGALTGLVGCSTPVITADGATKGMYSPCGADDPDCSSTVTQSGSGLGSGGGGGSGVALSAVESSVSELYYADAYGCEYFFSGEGVAVDSTWCPDCDLTLLTDYALVSDTCGYGYFDFKAAVAIRATETGLDVRLGYANYSYYYYDDYGYDYDYAATPSAPPAYSYSEMAAGTGELLGRALSYSLIREYETYYYYEYGYGYDDAYVRTFLFEGEATLY
jgi:hypothetical protein